MNRWRMVTHELFRMLAKLPSKKWLPTSQPP
jgi:hypothetical protein